MDTWSKNFSQKAIIYSFVITLGTSTLFFSYLMPISMLFIGLFIIAYFFIKLSYYSIHWQNISNNKFDSLLFRYSFVYRLIFVFYLYTLTYFLRPQNFPMELVDITDSWTYHTVAIHLSKIDFSNYFTHLKHLMAGPSDYGYPIYQSIIYKAFGDITFPVRLINCILGSYTVLFLTRMARLLYTENHARLTGIIAMLMPSLLWFGGIQLKETLMIFMVTAILYNAIKINETNRITIVRLSVIVIFSFFLFYFRTFLAVLMIFSILFYFAINFFKKNNMQSIIVIILFLFGLVPLINTTNFVNQSLDVYSQKDIIFDRKLESEAANVGNITYKKALVAPLIMVGAFVTPFPTFLVTEKRQLSIVAHFQNEIIRNLLFYFAIIGTFLTIKKYFRKSSILLFFTFSYLFVVTTASNSFIDRFQLPMLPYIIILMSVGIIEGTKKTIKHWNTYIILIFIAHISWTLFKLKIRGLL